MPSAFNRTGRYRFVDKFIDNQPGSVTKDLVFYGARSALRYQDNPGNRVHVVVGGDTLESLAARFFPGFADPAMVGWAIAEFQPEPLLDPTLRLSPGSLLIIPSQEFLFDLLSTPTPEVVV